MLERFSCRVAGSVRMDQQAGTVPPARREPGNVVGRFRPQAVKPEGLDSVGELGIGFLRSLARPVEAVT